ncbi:hypothetical protein ACQGRJ_10250 [Bacillus atrophaeus]|uniref:hypothetical protein n=1 Tax=Bacillus atrophaeus TaxID=1452 RepID=UPI003CF2200F
METKKYVRILKAPYRSIWYADKIGRIFPSLGTWENAYKVDSPDRALYIRKEDAEVIVTENRKAAVGERVLITDTGDPQAYENGKEYEVRQINSNGVSVSGRSLALFHNEYEVIVNNEVKNEEADEMKPTITKQQAEAIEELRINYSDEGILRSYTNDSLTVGENNCRCLYELDLLMLAAALVNGYEVEKTPEEKMREYHRSLVCDMDRALSYEEEGNYRSAIEAVEETLNLLGIEIEGVNA